MVTLQSAAYVLAGLRDTIGDIELLPLAAAICCQLLKVACTSRAWRNALAAAYPHANVRWRSTYAAQAAGAGVNAIFPARIGDLVRIGIARRAIPQSSYPTVLSSTFVLSIVDAAAVAALTGWALSNHVLPGIDILGALPGVRGGSLLGPGLAVWLPVVVGAVIGFVVLARIARSRLDALGHHVVQGLEIVRTPIRYLRDVAAWQLAGWGLRLATVWFLLGAFGIHQSARTVLVVQATASLATLAPVSPGGIGTSQALLLYTLGGEASRTAVLAFGVGMEVTLTAVDLVVGFGAILVIFRTLRFRAHLARRGTREATRGAVSAATRPAPARRPVESPAR